jgi:hypothetical protein
MDPGRTSREPARPSCRAEVGGADDAWHRVKLREPVTVWLSRVEI